MHFTRDKDNFNPEVHSPFKHSLVDHPLMQLESIKELALRHPKVRYHSARVSRNQKLDKVVDECPNGMTLEETLENIETAGSFVFIMDVQEDPIYGPLVNELLDQIEGMVHKKHSNMRGRQAWLFVTSPGGVTPYHHDQETAHFFHIKGRKKFWLWDKNDKEVVSQVENEFFHGVHGLAKTHYTDAKMQKATLYNIEPGDGVYFPYTAPHMVENNDEEYSISFSVTYMTDQDFAERRINKINQMMRKFGLKPKDLNVSPQVDNLKLAMHWFLRNIALRFSPNWKDA